jgi:hypothetical protein
MNAQARILFVLPALFLLVRLASRPTRVLASPERLAPVLGVTVDEDVGVLWRPSR